jgi:hypothetical protein
MSQNAIPFIYIFSLQHFTLRTTPYRPHPFLTSHLPYPIFYILYCIFHLAPSNSLAIAKSPPVAERLNRMGGAGLRGPNRPCSTPNRFFIFFLISLPSAAPFHLPPLRPSYIPRGPNLCRDALRRVHDPDGAGPYRTSTSAGMNPALHHRKSFNLQNECRAALAAAMSHSSLELTIPSAPT